MTTKLTWNQKEANRLLSYRSRLELIEGTRLQSVKGAAMQFYHAQTDEHAETIVHAVKELLHSRAELKDLLNGRYWSLIMNGMEIE